MKKLINRNLYIIKQKNDLNNYKYLKFSISYYNYNKKINMSQKLNIH